MKKITTLSIITIIVSIAIFQACEDKELPTIKNIGTNKIELALTQNNAV